MQQASDSTDLSQCPRAGLWRRLAALLYDAFLVLAIWMLLGYIVQMIVGTGSATLVDGQVQTDPVVDWILFSLMLGSALAFYLWFWARSGQTLGMMSWRLKVVDSNNRLLQPKQGLLRFALAWPSMLALGLGYLWLFLDPQGDALHDRLSGSKVLLVPKSARPFTR